MNRVRLKRIVKPIREPGRDGGYLGLEHVESATGRLVPAESKEEPAGALGFKVGDVLYGKLRPYLRKVYRAPVDGRCSSEFLVLRSVVGLDARFLRYVMLSDPVNEWAVANSDGAKMPRAEWGTIGLVEVYQPSLGEQRAVADYLDRETARIDRLVDNTQEELRLVVEKRTAVRDGAFGHRKQWRLKRLLRAPMAYGVLVPEFVEPGSGVPMIRTYNLTDRGSVDGADLPEIPRSLADDYQRTRVATGDLILSVVGSMGRAAVVSKEIAGANLNRPLARLQPMHELPARLLWHWTQTTIFADMARLATGGSTAQPTLNLGDLANFDVGLPTQTNDWGPLLSRLEDICDGLNRAEDGLKRQITLLSERRQALITALVIGHIPIPGAA